MKDSYVAYSNPSTTTHKPAVKRAGLNAPADMVLYAALVGKTPQIDPRLADPMVAVSQARRENPWSPMVLSLYLRQVCREKALKLNKPELTTWFKKQTNIARQRVGETRSRMHPVKTDGRAA